MGDVIIEMSKIRMDFARNEISGNTLRIIDKGFFDSIVAPTNDAVKSEEQKDGPNFAELSSKAANSIKRMLQPPQKLTTVPQSYFTNPFQDSDDASDQISDADREAAND